jgi:hypothetical protein
MHWVCLGKREVSEVVGPMALALPILPHLTPLGSLIQFYLSSLPPVRCFTATGSSLYLASA